jgi:hypothetical protein
MPTRTPARTSIAHEQVSMNMPTDRFIHRARRVHIDPTIDFPPPPLDIDDRPSHHHHYDDDDDDDNDDDQFTPSTGKRPSHNLLSNIVPSINTSPSTEQNSQPSTKQFTASFGFDTSMERRTTTDIYDEHIDVDSISSDTDRSNPIDYICKSTSTLAVTTPSTHTYYV